VIDCAIRSDDQREATKAAADQDAGLKDLRIEELDFSVLAHGDVTSEHREAYAR